MRRRRALGTLCSGLACLLAGCGGDTTDTPTATATETPAPTDRPTAAATPTASPTATPSPTATATATPAPSPVAHGLGERFVVGTDRRFAYVVHGLRTADRLLMTAAADGQRFVVADLTVEYLGTESSVLPVSDVWLRASGVQLTVSTSATNAAGNDSRVGARSLTGELPPRRPTRGVVAFSSAPVAPDDYRLQFTPSDTDGPVSEDPADTHLVPVGPLDALESVE